MQQMIKYREMWKSHEELMLEERVPKQILVCWSLEIMEGKLQTRTDNVLIHKEEEVIILLKDLHKMSDV